MQGDINDGDIIVNIQYKNLSTDGTFAVNIDVQMYVKILQRVSGNKIQVISKNTKYAPFTVDLNTEYFKFIGKIIWFGGEKDVCQVFKIYFKYFFTCNNSPFGMILNTKFLRLNMSYLCSDNSTSVFDFAELANPFNYASNY